MSFDPAQLGDHLKRATAQLAAFRVLEVVPEATIKLVPNGYQVTLLGASETNRDLSLAVIAAATAAGVVIPEEPKIKLGPKS